MISDRAAKYLWDARRAGEAALNFVSGRSLADFLADELLRSAVERKFIIIGEALGEFRRAEPAAAATIPDLGRIVGFRHVLVHGYDGISQEAVWSVVENGLPDLLLILGRLLDEVDGQSRVAKPNSS